MRAACRTCPQDAEGKYHFRYGDPSKNDGEGAQRSFFLPPYWEVRNGGRGAAYEPIGVKERESFKQVVLQVMKKMMAMQTCVPRVSCTAVGCCISSTLSAWCASKMTMPVRCPGRVADVEPWAAAGAPRPAHHHV